MKTNSKTKLFAILFSAVALVVFVFATALLEKKESFSEVTKKIENFENIQNAPDDVSKVENFGSQEKSSSANKIQQSVAVQMSLENGESFSLLGMEGSSLYELMQNSQVPFSGKEFPVLGFMVESIGANKLESQNGKYLFYYINGQEAQVGVSQYKPKYGDRIEWKLK